MASPESKKLLELLWKNYPGPSSYEQMKNKVDKMRANFVQATKNFATPPPIPRSGRSMWTASRPSGSAPRA